MPINQLGDSFNPRSRLSHHALTHAHALFHERSSRTHFRTAVGCHRGRIQEPAARWATELLRRLH